MKSKSKSDLLGTDWESESGRGKGKRGKQSIVVGRQRSPCHKNALVFRYRQNKKGEMGISEVETYERNENPRRSIKKTKKKKKEDKKLVT
jgi:hypothetical protein